MGNCCDVDKKRQQPQQLLEDLGAKSSLQISKSNQRHPLRKLPSGYDSSSALASLAEPTIKVTVQAGAEEETDGKLEIEEANKQPNKRHFSGQSFDSTSSCSSFGSNGLKRKNLTISDFIIDKPLGKGAFGQVYLVTKKDTERKYAMKTIKKVDMVKLQLIEATILEKTILLRSFHPFVVSLKYSIQTDKKVYLIMEYVQGGEIFTLLENLGRFSENVAKFIIAEIILGIQYLHETLKIIYRDLKPENILLTKSGHIKISDFGLSKEYQNKDDKAYTFAGTPEYMAPEVVLNKGHNKNVDLWGIGIFLYELVAGHPPFSDKNRNVEKIQKQVIMNRPIYPQAFSANLKDLIKSLLQSDPNERLGANSMDDLKSHSFFHDVQWEELLKLSIESPLKKYTDQEKPLQIIRPRPILETPMSLNIQLPQIKNLTYNNEDTLQALPKESEIVKEKFDEPSPKNTKIK